MSVAHMNLFLDDFLVGLVLFAGFAYALCSLAPKSWRARLLNGGAVLLGRVPTTAVRGIAARLAAAAMAKSSCGGCDNCGSSSAGSEGKEREIKIAPSQIGKRSSAGRR